MRNDPEKQGVPNAGELVLVYHEWEKVFTLDSDQFPNASPLNISH